MGRGPRGLAVSQSGRESLQILGLEVSSEESGAGWLSFFPVVAGGLTGVALVRWP